MAELLNEPARAGNSWLISRRGMWLWAVIAAVIIALLALRLTQALALKKNIN